jgi:hypothetical protein
MPMYRIKQILKSRKLGAMLIMPVILIGLVVSVFALPLTKGSVASASDYYDWNGGYGDSLDDGSNYYDNGYNSGNLNDDDYYDYNYNRDYSRYDGCRDQYYQSSLDSDSLCVSYTEANCYDFYSADWESGMCSPSFNSDGTIDTSFSKDDIIPQYEDIECAPGGYRFYLYARKSGGRGNDTSGPLICAYYPNKDRSQLRWFPRIYNKTNI